MNKIKGLLYVAHADNDPSMPMDQIAIFNEAFLNAGVKGKTELYERAMYGFTMRDLPPYNEAALNRHWENLLKLLTDM